MTTDKTLHFLAGLTISLFFCIIHPAAGLMAAFLAGLAKEGYDVRVKRSFFDWQDVAATVAGGVIAVLLAAAISTATAGTLSLEWRAAVVPPAHEPVVGDKVARYMIEITPQVETDYARAELTLRSWGVQTWRTPTVRGSGWEKYEDSDWGVEKWRTGMTARGELGPDVLHLYTEYYYPFDRKSWGGHGLERHYYWLVGVGGRL